MHSKAFQCLLALTIHSNYATAKKGAMKLTVEFLSTCEPVSSDPEEKPERIKSIRREEDCMKVTEAILSCRELVMKVG